MRNSILLVALTTLLTWNCSPEDEDEPAATNSTSSSGQTNSTPTEPTEPALSADGITFALVEDSGNDNDKITTNANVVISGEVPDDAELAFVVMTNQTNHSNDVSTTGTNDFGLAAPTSGTLSVSVQAQLTKDDETAEGTAFEYTLFSWPASVSVSYTDNGESNDDGVTTESELTFSGFGVSGLDIKLSAYRITNTSTTMLENTVDIDEDDQQSLSSGYRINMRDVKPSLDDNEKIHSITLDYKGHSVDYTFDPGLDYRAGFYKRKFDSANNCYGIAIDSNDVLFIASISPDRLHFYNLDGTDATITVGDSTASNFGSPGTENNQFSQPYSVVIGSDGKIYVAELLGSRVQVFEAGFSHHTNITGFTSALALLLHDGYLYVVTPSVINTYAENDLTNQGSNITGGFNGLDVDSDGVFHLANRNDDRVEAWTGSPTEGFSNTTHSYNMRPGNGGDASSTPWAVVVGPTTGRIYVSDNVRDHIVVLSYDGSAYTLVGVLGTSGSGDGQLDNPRGILIHDGQLYIVEQNSDRVHVFTVPE